MSGSSLVRPVYNFPNLETLDNYKIDSLQALQIKCPNLTALDISVCPNLENVTWDCPNLVHICIKTKTRKTKEFSLTNPDMAGSDKFTNEEFCKMTSACQNLTKVMMSKLLNINDDVAVALCTLPKLQILNMSDCPLITSKTMEQLYHIFPHIAFYQ